MCVALYANANTAPPENCVFSRARCLAWEQQLCYVNCFWETIRLFTCVLLVVVLCIHVTSRCATYGFRLIPFMSNRPPYHIISFNDCISIQCNIKEQYRCQLKRFTLLLGLRIKTVCATRMPSYNSHTQFNCLIMQCVLLLMLYHLIVGTALMLTTMQCRFGK